MNHKYDLFSRGKKIKEGHVRTAEMDFEAAIHNSACNKRYKSNFLTVSEKIENVNKEIQL